MSNFQGHYDVLPNGSFVYYADTIPSNNGIAGRLGDYCLFTSLNNSAAGNPVGWVCTVGANTTNTYGTWVPLGATQTFVTAGGNNNAITVSLPNVPLYTGLQLFVFLAGLTLTNGANTISYNGGNNNNIKSHLTRANNIATAYSANSIVPLMYDGNNFQDLSQ